MNLLFLLKMYKSILYTSVIEGSNNDTDNIARRKKCMTHHLNWMLGVMHVVTAASESVFS